MTLNRMSLTLTVLVVFLFAALIFAAMAGASTSPSPTTTTDSNSFVPWHKAKPQPMYAKVTYREHHMCDEVRHPAMKQSPKL